MTFKNKKWRIIGAKGNIHRPKKKKLSKGNDLWRKGVNLKLLGETGERKSSNLKECSSSQILSVPQVQIVFMWENKIISLIIY